MKNSAIEWCHDTVNFWWGCSFARYLDGSVREECEHCYALTLSKIFSRGRATWGQNGKRWIRAEKAYVELARLDQYARERGERRRVFINSMSDTFEDFRQELREARGLLFLACEKVTNLDILLLTKRPGNVLQMVPCQWLTKWPAHVWIGTTAGTQKAADENVPALLRIPARVRFLSMEPLLGPVNLDFGHPKWRTAESYHAYIHWVIVGGESGHGARPMHPDWARSLRDQCAAAGVAFFFKQWGEWFPGSSDGDEFTLDDRHGEPEVGDRKFKVHAFPAEADGTFQEMGRIGKAAAGRVLDGVEHTAVPEVRPRREREYLVVYGPPASGKTLNAQAMKEALGYDHVFDADFHGLEILEARGRIILLAHSEEVRCPDDRRRFVLRKKPIEAVKRLLGARWTEPRSEVRQ